MLAVLDVVVRNEGNAKSSSNRSIIVHYVGHRVGELDDSLRHHVSGRSLTRKYDCARRRTAFRVVLKAVIERDDVKQVQMLPLVLMEALNLDVEHTCGISRNSRLPLNLG